ncbi:energy transducer TonB [Marinomonas agarivorans]|nr:energy transducer TonB [Marinomonas agarivorans]
MNITDRFSISLLFAITVHALLVLFVGFDFTLFEPPKKTLEITLVKHKTSQPKEADFIAQANQEASGTEIRKQKLTTTEESPLLADDIYEITTPVQPQIASSTPEETTATIVTTNPESVFRIATENPTETKTLEELFRGETQLPSHLTTDIATLEALLDQQRQAYAKRPRIRRLTSVSAKAAIDAKYLDDWRRRIERIGNIHYPSEAKRNKLYGQLRLAVMLSPNGYVDDIEILKSSGVRVLDDAAMRIVRLSEPFAEFPPELKAEIDKLEIIRTWQFIPGNQLQSSQ